MNRLMTHMSKPLALLAIMLLPVQQSLAASCCCHGGVNHTSSTDCCSRREASCCDGTSSLGRSCCQASSPDSKSEPCQCPGGCCDSATPDAFALSADSALKINLSAATVQGISTIACEITTRNSLAGSVAAGSASGLKLCVLLCRYRL